MRRHNRRYFRLGLLALLGAGIGVVVVSMVNWLIMR
jgi:hypothetical protein